MLKAPLYKIWKVMEAKKAGYTRTRNHFSKLGGCLKFIDAKEEKAKWLRVLTPDKIEMLRSYLDVSSLIYAFIIVDEDGHSEYKRKSLGDRYSIWWRDVTRDN